jgi:hypothetical protein
MGQDSWSRQLGQENSGRTGMAGKIQQDGEKRKTGQDNRGRTDSQEMTARTGQGQLGQDDQHRTNAADSHDGTART